MKKKIILYTLYILVVVIIFIPLNQQLFPIVKEKELNGYFEYTPKPELNNSNWTNLNYQNNIEKYTKENIGFRNFFVRTYNQINYSFFNTTNAGGIYVGKNKYLYEDGYIRNYLGLNFLGEDSISTLVNHLSEVRDSLEFFGKNLVVVIAPGKGSFYPEYLPKEFSDIAPRTTNFEIIDKELRKHNINYIDFNSWMLSQKGSAKYRLFPSTGLHWGEYACYLAIDSITNYFDNLYSINLPRIKVKNIELSSKMRFKDDDAEKLMNLLFDIPDIPMPQLETTIDSSSQDKLKVLIMGDSYHYSLSYLGLEKYVFNDSEYWYYFNEVHRFENDNINFSFYGLVRDYDDIKVEILKYDLVMILMTEGTLQFTPSLFFEELYSQFVNDERSRQYKFSLEKYKNAIINDKQWYSDIVKKAKARGVSVEQAIDDDAKYMVEEFFKEKKD